MRKIFFLLVLHLVNDCFGQNVGIGTMNPETSAALDISSNNKGLLIPRLSRQQLQSISSPAKGLLVFQSDDSSFYYFDGAWKRIASAQESWLLKGNAGNGDFDFLGTKDNKPIFFRVNDSLSGMIHKNMMNTSFGFQSLSKNINGYSNTAIGHYSMFSSQYGFFNVAIGDRSLFSNNSGSNNTAGGYLALSANQGGSQNTAIGRGALMSNVDAYDNTAVGSNALRSNVIGVSNTAIGANASYSGVVGSYNTAVGESAMYNNNIGANNTAVGARSLYNNSQGTDNSSFGVEALFSNNIGSQNTSIGARTLVSNIDGTGNSAFGSGSLSGNISGSFNTASGFNSLSRNKNSNYNTSFGSFSMQLNDSGRNNTAIGTFSLGANISGSNNTAVGFTALSSNTLGYGNVAVGDSAMRSNLDGFFNTVVGHAANVASSGLFNATALGNGAIVNASNKVRIGNINVTVIEGQVPFTNPSDGRFKFDVKEDIKGLSFILKLRPVTYYFDRQSLENYILGVPSTQNNVDNLNKYEVLGMFDTKRQSGFIAQEVEAAAKSVQFDFDGVRTPDTGNSYYSLSYASFVIPLVKAVQEQQAIIDEQNAKINALHQQLIELKKSIELLNTRIK